MPWYGATTSDQLLESKFTEFVLKQGGERVADLLPRQRDAPLNADYLLWNRSVVAELKCLTQDHYRDDAVREKMQRLAKGWIQRGLVPRAPPGVRKHIVSSEGLPLKEQHKANSVLSSGLKAALAKASRQIRSTKHVLGLPHAKGLVIVANLADASLPPRSAWDVLGYLLSGHTNGTFDSCVFISPIADRRFADSEAALWMSGSCPRSVGVDPQLLGDLMVAWNEFAGEGKSRLIHASPEMLDRWPEPPESAR